MGKTFFGRVKEAHYPNEVQTAIVNAAVKASVGIKRTGAHEEITPTDPDHPARMGHDRRVRYGNRSGDVGAGVDPNLVDTIPPMDPKDFEEQLPKHLKDLLNR